MNDQEVGISLTKYGFAWERTRWQAESWFVLEARIHKKHMHTKTTHVSWMKKQLCTMPSETLDSRSFLWGISRHYASTLSFLEILLWRAVGLIRARLAHGFHGRPARRWHRPLACLEAQATWCWHKHGVELTLEASEALAKDTDSRSSSPPSGPLPLLDRVSSPTCEKKLPRCTVGSTCGPSWFGYDVFGRHVVKLWQD